PTLFRSSARGGPVSPSACCCWRSACCSGCWRATARPEAIRMDKTRVARRGRWRLLLAAAGLAWLAWLPVQAAAPVGEVASPDGRIQVQVTQDAEGRPTWRLLREGREVVAPSPLGMVGEGAELSQGL